MITQEDTDLQSHMFLTMSAEPPPPKKPRKQWEDVFPCDLQPWKDSRGIDTFLTNAEETSALWELALKEFGGKPANQLFWKAKREETRSNGSIRRLYYCAYHYDHKCLFRVCTIWKPDTKTYQIFVGSKGHDYATVHVKRTYKSAGVTAVQSSTCLDKGSMRLLKTASKTHEMTTDEQGSLYRHIQRLKNKVTEARLQTGSNGKNWADLHAKCAIHMRKNIETFSVHNAYILNEYYDFDESTQRFIVVMSTKNLVLNAYRQLASTGSIVFAVDTSYQYTHEKFGLMPINTVNLAQEGKTIAYAICSNEDHEAHEHHIFKAVHIEVERNHQ
jgi:hypothetical protein